MRFNFDRELAQYKFIQEIKKVNHSFYNGGVLFNQEVLMACGQIDYGLNRLSRVDRDRFIVDNKDFFEGLAWVYYQDWRKTRAKSCAHLMDVYRLLNVNMSVEYFVGETFFAGIPKVTIGEIDNVSKPVKYGGKNLENIWQERYGVDGRLHPCDESGSFPDIIDFNDVYGDRTMVTKRELDSSMKGMTK